MLEYQWTQDETILFYCGVIFAVMGLFAGLFWWGTEIETQTQRAENTLYELKFLKAFDPSREVP